MRRRDFQLAPRGQTWNGFFAGLDMNRSTDVRDRAILMLFAIYGLRESEVAKLRLDDIDWEHDQLRIPRAKRREAQVYPLLPSVGRALTDYLLSVRRYQHRIHDIRHSAAVHRVIAWYRAGADVQRLMPQLATYLGHVDVASTQRYLTMTAELLNEASLRFERYAQPEVRHA